MINCRCCGKPSNYTETLPRVLVAFHADTHPIHTACIVKHWDKHAKGINASRCKEFGK